MSILYSQKVSITWKNNDWDYVQNEDYDIIKADSYYKFGDGLQGKNDPAEYLQQSIALHSLPGNNFKRKIKAINKAIELTEKTDFKDRNGYLYLHKALYLEKV